MCGIFINYLKNNKNLAQNKFNFASKKEMIYLKKNQLTFVIYRESIQFLVATLLYNHKRPSQCPSVSITEKRDFSVSNEYRGPFFPCRFS